MSEGKIVFPEKPAGAFLRGLSYPAAVIGVLLILLTVPEGLTADNGIGVVFLAVGLSLSLSSPFIWAAGKALELLSRIEANTRNG